MSDPPRLLERPETSSSAAELLRALDPPAAPPPAIELALAKQLSTMVASSAAQSAAGAVWLKVVLVGVATLGGAGMFVWSRSPAPNPPLAAQTARAPGPALPVSTAPAPPLESAVQPAPAAATSASVKQRAPSPVTPRDVLAEEEALLEAARRALASDPARAYSLLQRHRSQFPNGQLGAERMFLSVECLQRLGKSDAAKREAASLAKHYPSSTYARRARQLTGSPE
ncbi:MAG TPA: hypothetical protein VM686_21685 [Polyangiaceae bacterium]|nr:hypothetical protein [Polyangiaceae bacterium]